MQVTIRYKLHRHLMNKGLTLKKEYYKALEKKKLEQSFSSLSKHHKMHMLYEATTCM